MKITHSCLRSYYLAPVKVRLLLFARLALLWVLFFVVARLLFLAYQWEASATLSLADSLTIMWLGLRMDLAMAAYWLALPGLLLVGSFLVPGKWVKHLISGLFYLVLAISSLIVTADLELYHHWNFRMDTTPLFYAGSEGLGSISFGRLAFLGSIFLMLAAFAGYAYHCWVLRLWPLPPSQKRGAWLMLGLTGALFLPMRSSVSVAPLNTGFVFFHPTNTFANHAGINVVWNFFKSVVSDNALRYPKLMAAEEAEKGFQSMMQSTLRTERVLSNRQPNVLLIILESFTAKVVEPLGGAPNTTPNLNKLCREGILFTECYASGDRTDKGLVSILSGYPAQPKTSIIKYPNKTQSLPKLPARMNELGYTTSFVYGGDAGFANMESYLTMCGFESMTQDSDFDPALNISKWGVHDEHLFARTLAELDTATGPFFKTVLTLSSHEPFDVAFEEPQVQGEANKFLRACRYTDKHLGAFMDAAKQKPWWKNTLVILTADHGHRLPDNARVNNPARFKIPLLWTGGAVPNAFQFSMPCSQLDLANTLLAQLDKPSADFMFSKNLFAPHQPFAVYSFHNGYGYVAAGYEILYDFDFKNYQTKKLPPGQTANPALFFMQTLFNDYNKR